MSICFTGSGMNSIYQAGVASYIQDNYDIDNVILLGNSGGSIISSLLRINYPMNNFIYDAHKEITIAKSTYLKHIHMSNINYEYMKNIFKDTNIDKINNKLYISITTPKFKNQLINTFTDVENLIDIISVSCWIPLFFNKLPFYKYNNKYCYGFDGGFTNNTPIIDTNTLIITPYNNKYENPTINGNLSKISSLYLYDYNELHKIFKKGYYDALLNNNIINNCLF